MIEGFLNGSKERGLKARTVPFSACWWITSGLLLWLRWASDFQAEAKVEESK